MNINTISKFKPLNFFIGFTILASSLRSLIPLMFNDGSFAYPSIQISFFLGLIAASLSIIKAFDIKKTGRYSFILVFMFLNLFINILWHIPYLVTLNYSEMSMIIYTGIFPFSFFLFLRLNEKTLLRIFAIILVVVSISIIWESYELNTGQETGYESAYARQLILRPDTTEYFGRSGTLLRTGGLLGIRPHDSGSLLAILCILFAGLAIRKRNSFSTEVFLALLSFIALMLSQSGSNIAVFFVGILILFLMYRKVFWNYKLILFVIFSTCFSVSLISMSNPIIDELSALSERLLIRFSLEHGDWSGMTQMGFTNKFLDLWSFLFGYCTLIGCKISSVTEVSFIGTLVEYGFFYFSLFMLVISYPVVVYFKQIKPTKIAIPYVVAVFVGFLSLWHYGTVLRTTNIFVYFSIYAIALKNLYNSAEKGSNF